MFDAQRLLPASLRIGMARRGVPCRAAYRISNAKLPGGMKSRVSFYPPFSQLEYGKKLILNIGFIIFVVNRSEVG